MVEIAEGPDSDVRFERVRARLAELGAIVMSRGSFMLAENEATERIRETVGPSLGRDDHVYVFGVEDGQFFCHAVAHPHEECQTGRAVSGPREDS